MQLVVLVETVEPSGQVTEMAHWVEDEAVAEQIAQEEFEYFLDTRIIDLHVRVYTWQRTLLSERHLDDAQQYYDHRCYRIGETERSYLDLVTPHEEREDRRRYETNIIVGFRDNLDATIAVATRRTDQPITHEYLDEMWKLVG